MSTTSEYGEEGMVQAQEAEVEQSAGGAGPTYEHLLQPGKQERAEEEHEIAYLDAESNEAHAPADQVCEYCGAEIAPTADARRLPDGRWIHEVCPPPGRETPA